MGVSSFAHALYEPKDSIYFMLHDGEQSPEEMDEEAMYVYERCEANKMQRTYFKCECIAGAFRLEREKKGPFVPQSTIVNDLFNENERGCTNKAAIAGDAYEFCEEHVKTFSPRARGNKKYCECVGNKMAKDFAKEPKLRTYYIEDLTSDAMGFCRK